MAKSKDNNTSTSPDCPTAATGDVQSTERPMVETSATGFRYVGPNFVTGCVVNGRKYDPQSWDETKAKAEIEREPYLSKYFIFSNNQNLESNEA